MQCKSNGSSLSKSQPRQKGMAMAKSGKFSKMSKSKMTVKQGGRIKSPATLNP